MTQLRTGLLALIIALCCGPAHAIVLSVLPSASTLAPDASFSVALRISGLGSASAPSLGAFDVNLHYAPDVIQFTSIAFGDPVLDDQLDPGLLGSIQGHSALPGSLNLFQVSLTAASELDSWQADEFTIATLYFKAIAPNTFSDLSPEIIALADANGDPLMASELGARIATTGTPPPGEVPEPGTVACLLLGAAGLAALRRQRMAS